jgi:hypothetical protein
LRIDGRDLEDFAALVFLAYPCAGSGMLALAQIGEDTMPELLNLVLEAHGGIGRWRTFDTVRATFVSSGGLLPLKGLDVTPSPSEGVATIHEETLRIDGYRRPE